MTNTPKHNLIGEIYCHQKTGKKYEFLGMALWEPTKQTAVIYRCMESEMVWIRPATEFFDGRFQIVLPEQKTPTFAPKKELKELIFTQDDMV